MKIIKSIFTLCSLVLLLDGRAQQISLNTLYNQNFLLINPAAAGKSGCFSAYLNHRNQWVGINNSPLRNRLTLDGRVKNNHGIGLDLSMLQAGLLSDFSAKATYAHHIQLSKKTFLSAGFSAGITQQNFNLSDVIASDYSDNTLAQGNQSDMGFNSDAGVLFYTDRIRIGVSIPQVYSTGIGIQMSGVEEEYKLVNHMIFAAGIDVVSSDSWKVTPSLVYRNASFKANQMDVSMRVGWNNLVGISVLYRSSYGFAGVFDLNIADRFNLAYSYGFGTSSSITGISKGAHELMLGIKLCKKEKPIEDILTENALVTKELVPVVKDSLLTKQHVIEDIITSDKVIIQDTLIAEISNVEPWEIDVDSLNAAFLKKDKVILFKLNSSRDVISGNQKQVVDEVVVLLQNHLDLNITIEGFTCDIGTTEQNMVVSSERAEAIKDFLIKKGVSPGRIQVAPKGESNPLRSNSNEENRSQNRRVIIVFRR